MENVSKALILAGAVLIGVFLLFNLNTSMKQTGQFTQSYIDKLDRNRLAQYNSDFNKYTGSQMSMYDVATIMNKALEINMACGFNQDTVDYITVKIKFTSGTGKDLYNDKTDFLRVFYKDGKFDMNGDGTEDISGTGIDGYNAAIYDLLRDYYDNAINWNHASATVDRPVDLNNVPIDKIDDAKIPAFYMTIDNYAAGQVSAITFTQKGNLKQD